MSTALSKVSLVLETAENLLRDTSSGLAHGTLSSKDARGYLAQTAEALALARREVTRLANVVPMQVFIGGKQ